MERTNHQKCEFCDLDDVEQRVFGCRAIICKLLDPHHFLCSVCHKSFKTEERLNDHKQTHGPPKWTSICRAQFSLNRNLMQSNEILRFKRKQKYCPTNASINISRTTIKTNYSRIHLFISDEFLCSNIVKDLGLFFYLNRVLFSCDF